MDIAQTKLTKLEWESIEIPVSDDEKKILNLIRDGFNTPTICFNETPSLFNILKIEQSDNVDSYLFNQYIANMLKLPNKIIQAEMPIFNPKKMNIKKMTQMKLKNSELSFETKKNTIYEFIIIEVLTNLSHAIEKNDDTFTVHFYTLKKLLHLNITNKNSTLIDYCNKVLTKYKTNITNLQIIKNSYDIIERNNYLIKYGDIKLFDHQKKIFSIYNNKDSRETPSLTLYIAPTATGKTLTPIGLSENYRIIFICAARHVGLALAKSAISIGKKIALAFDCVDATGVRLHNYSACEFIKHEYYDQDTPKQRCRCGRRKCKEIGNNIKYKDGSQKTDHTVGNRVEIMICDVKSYISAMYYMMSFNDTENIITYWDEPTISMDNEEHELHESINNNWKNNLIPKLVLSSATLPKQEEIFETIQDFRVKFNGAETYSIVSHDCQKSIPITDSDCYTCLPHLLWENYRDLIKSVEHCIQNKTLLRYFDLQEIIEFIIYANTNADIITDERYKSEIYFESIYDINMTNLKVYYLDILQNISADIWSNMYTHFQQQRKKNYMSNTKMVTSDSYTLTDGPSIFLAEDISKVGKVCIKTANIPQKVMQDLNEAIDFNNKVNIELKKHEHAFEDLKNKLSIDEDSKKFDRMSSNDTPNSNMKTLKTKIDGLRSMIKLIKLNDLFIPNRKDHIEKWAPGKKCKKSFTCNIAEHHVIKIMELDDVDDSWKILLLMGIGVFAEHRSIDYTEVMKELAREQKLFMIIASSNYIYGTNYQFCHGYIGKDMSENMTQEKCIQAMGRVGRNKVQQTYSIRFRDNELIKRLLLPEENKIEVRVMNRLFNSDD